MGVIWDSNTNSIVDESVYRGYSTPSGGNPSTNAMGVEKIYEDPFTFQNEEFDYQGLSNQYQGTSPTSSRQPWEEYIVGTPRYDFSEGGSIPSSSTSSNYKSEDDIWNENLRKELDAKYAAENAAWNQKPRGSSSTYGSSGGAYGAYGNIVTGQQRPITPPGPMPTMGDLPEFLAPERDDQRVKELTQQKSAAGLRAMRSQIQRAMGQGYRNENVRRMTLRDALSGYGQGIESVMSGAQTQAERDYNTEYAQKYDTAGKNWQTAVTSKMQDWQNKVADYMRQYGTSQTTVRV